MAHDEYAAWNRVVEREAFRKTLRALPGYPWLPCPICKGTGSCDHIAAERAQAALPGLHFDTNNLQQ
jgi:hypothetical protein